MQNQPNWNNTASYWLNNEVYIDVETCRKKTVLSLIDRPTSNLNITIEKRIRVLLNFLIDDNSMFV